MPSATKTAIVFYSSYIITMLYLEKSWLNIYFTYFKVVHVFDSVIDIIHISFNRLYLTYWISDFSNKKENPHCFSKHLYFDWGKIELLPTSNGKLADLTHLAFNHVMPMLVCKKVARLILFFIYTVLATLLTHAGALNFLYSLHLRVNTKVWSSVAQWICSPRNESLVVIFFYLQVHKLSSYRCSKHEHQLWCHVNDMLHDVAVPLTQSCKR